MQIIRVTRAEVLAAQLLVDMNAADGIETPREVVELANAKPLDPSAGSQMVEPTRAEVLAAQLLVDMNAADGIETPTDIVELARMTPVGPRGSGTTAAS